MTQSFSDMCIICKSHFILTCILMAGLLTLIILLDYYKLQKKKLLIGIFVGILVAIGCAVFGLGLVEPIMDMGEITDISTYFAILIIGALVAAILIISVLTFIVLERMRAKNLKKSLYPVLFSAIGFMGALLVTAVILITFTLPNPPKNLHLAPFIGFPALLLLSIGTIMVIYNEEKLVIYHGLTAGSSWLLTTLNILLLFSMSEFEMTEFSGVLHTFHILCGAIGLISGFLSALFGISGQRKLAKLSGYITLGCWWTAYVVAPFIAG
ncbi:MAG: hypothetical protein EU530_04055 [Promethearchaeota archaeon]|nr:MAG: hypothetical protein EU530_04055 [Candidatus Lokiarchaeota archaeon]